MFEAFRRELEQAVPRADRSKGGRPPYDHVLMFRILILQASHSLSDERTEYLIKGRLSFMRFLGLSLADRVPDANSAGTPPIAARVSPAPIIPTPPKTPSAKR